MYGIASNSVWYVMPKEREGHRRTHQIDIVIEGISNCKNIKSQTKSKSQIITVVTSQAGTKNEGFSLDTS